MTRNRYDTDTRAPVERLMANVQTDEHHHQAVTGLTRTLELTPEERQELDFCRPGERVHGSADYRGRASYWTWMVREWSDEEIKQALALLAEQP